MGAGNPVAEREALVRRQNHLNTKYQQMNNEIQAIQRRLADRERHAQKLMQEIERTARKVQHLDGVIARRR